MLKENEIVDAAKRGYFLNYSTGVVRCMVGKPQPFFVNVPHSITITQFYIRKIASLKNGVYTFSDYVNVGYPKLLLKKEGDLEDSYASIVEALRHCSAQTKAKINIRMIETTGIDTDADAEKALKGIDGVIVPGGFGNRGIEGKIKIIK